MYHVCFTVFWYHTGHMAVVKWLVEHRKEGCSYRAMDWAAHNGKFIYAEVQAVLLELRKCVRATVHRLMMY
jgi:hypothetical protein